ncbi:MULTISPECIES: fatty acid desaturase [unclassified Burkholderia]|uniref:acyl-CoA desaturase n=1 Tax=unclassified Burkholderia TaxID=2613784 RepID=UPI001423B3D2|nr:MULTISPECIES: fatty acid desaturase [unclassified Burkholderia]NIE57324.1 acyl-CoA desaturase [Burkholderia sp. Ap-955]NIF08050.1 acyl-CoA desaturase [Burkholderia sp. Ax-1735]NIG02054.1 acyl-CoA desaturase [Burkholderia sp. Tr-849]
MSQNLDDNEDNNAAVPGASSSDAGGRRMINSPHLHKLQKRHFLMFGVGPFVGTLCALSLLFVRGIGWPEVVAFFVMWAVTGLCVSAGFHRLFAHKAYETGPILRSVIAICGSMAAQGSVVAWVAIHRRHHEYSDNEGDLHSPNLAGPGLKGKLKGWLHAHLTWMLAYPFPNPTQYAPDLLRDERMMFVNRHYRKWVLLGLVIPAVGCALIEHSWWGLATGFLWGGMVRICAVAHGMWSLNSVCHLIGTRRFATSDESRNVSWLAPFVFGESWHHNHHAFPRSASFGLEWHRIDPGFWLIWLLGKTGLVHGIQVPSREQIVQRAIG